MNMKYKMIAWVTGIILLVVVLMAVIVSMEPAKEGIPRAQACKALALALTSREECEKQEAERPSSWFSDRERNNWFVKYMDYLYEEGYLDSQLTPPTLATAQGELTYEEAAFLAERVAGRLKAQTGVTKYNKSSAFPQEEWWKLYDAILERVDGSGAVEEIDAVLYGTPSNLTQADSWTAYTTQGNFRFEGLALDSFLDCEIRFLARGGEMIAMLELVNSDAIYENVWLAQADAEHFLVYLGSTYREFSVKEGAISADEAAALKDLAPNLVDIEMKDGTLKNVTVKKERISGKVLSVTGDTIEIEGYGELPLSPQFRVYKVYGDFQVLGANDILVGYNLQEFVAADGKLCAALLEQEFDAKTIRVLLMDTGFSSIFHSSADIALICRATLEYTNARGKTESEMLEAGTVLSLTPEDKRLAFGRILLTPEEPESMELRSVERGQGCPVYSGRLEIKAEENGLVLVNDLYLEDYLTKVVPSEMPPSYEAEALKAQAVCARTYACRQILGNAYSQYGAHVDDSTNFQVYNNIRTDARTTQAVKDTYGKMLFSDGKPAEAFYYSTSCGRGTDGSIWGGEGGKLSYLRAMEIRNGGRQLNGDNADDFESFIRRRDVTAWDSSFPMFRWETDIPASLLSAQINGAGEVEDVSVISRGAGGIVEELVVSGSRETIHIKGESAVRTALGNESLSIERQDGSVMTGSSSLPSAFIALEKRQAEDGSVSFHVYGGGFGHGVGMSQNGAQGMAKNGLGYEEILKFFYDGAQLQD